MIIFFEENYKINFMKVNSNYSHGDRKSLMAIDT